MAEDRTDRAELADKLLEGVTSAEDPLRAMAEMIADFMMEAKVTAKVGAEVHERGPERTTYQNGFRDRRWDTRMGTLALKVPNLREGGYVPNFIEPELCTAAIAAAFRVPEASIKGGAIMDHETPLERRFVAVEK